MLTSVRARLLIRVRYAKICESSNFGSVHNVYLCNIRLDKLRPSIYGKYGKYLDLPSIYGYDSDSKSTRPSIPMAPTLCYEYDLQLTPKQLLIYHTDHSFCSMVCVVVVHIAISAIKLIYVRVSVCIFKCVCVCVRARACVWLFVCLPRLSLFIYAFTPVSYTHLDVYKRQS